MRQIPLPKNPPPVPEPNERSTDKISYAGWENRQITGKQKAVKIACIFTA
jgi:hypothetical protein